MLALHKEAEKTCERERERWRFTNQKRLELMPSEEEKDSQSDIGTWGKWVFNLRIIWEMMRSESSVVFTSWWSLDVPDGVCKVLITGCNTRGT